MPAANFAGSGSSAVATAERELRSQYRAGRPRRVDRDEGLTCPECGRIRRTIETLRVHRWLAHGIESLAA